MGFFAESVILQAPRSKNALVLGTISHAFVPGFLYAKVQPTLLDLNNLNTVQSPLLMTLPTRFPFVENN